MDNEEIFEYLDILKNRAIKEVESVKSLLKLQFSISDDQAQEFIWAWKMKD